jgi:formate hydrogenlyase subunit 4
MTLRILCNLLRAAVVIAFTPFVEGVATRLKEMLQSKAAPDILQPRRDLSKLLHNDEVVPKQSSWLFRSTPSVAFAAPAQVALLSPGLTHYPLFFAFMGDREESVVDRQVLGASIDTLRKFADASRRMHVGIGR